MTRRNFLLLGYILNGKEYYIFCLPILYRQILLKKLEASDLNKRFFYRSNKDRF